MDPTKFYSGEDIIDLLPFIMPLLPLLFYGIAAIRFEKSIKLPLDHGLEQDREYRNVSLMIIGIIFSMSGILGVLYKDLPGNSTLILYYIYSCLTCFLCVFFLQRFRRLIWHDMASDCLLDMGILYLILTLIAIVTSTGYKQVALLPISVSLVCWIIYAFLHFKYYFGYLASIKEVGSEK